MAALLSDPALLLRSVSVVAAAFDEGNSPAAVLSASKCDRPGRIEPSPWKTRNWNGPKRSDPSPPPGRATSFSLVSLPE